MLATGRRAEALEELDGVRRFVCDLREPGAPEACVAEGVEQLGGLDGVVHAAGTVLRGQDPRSSSDEEIDGMLLDNLAVPQRVARAALGALGRGGSLVLVSSQLAHIGAPGYSSYCAAKGGVDALVRALAVEVGPDGIRVNAVAPGRRAARRWPTTGARTSTSSCRRSPSGTRCAASARPRTSRGRWRSCSRTRRAWMTGQTIVVDGGYTIQ